MHCLWLKETALLVQVTDQDTNATLYFEALNYNIA